ncbi:hypothetical protein Mapa_008450 [Marchantia paleacea]|nr:hypothetical protein Mapa_008450 [Marchantia paleacea]
MIATASWHYLSISIHVKRLSSMNSRSLRAGIKQRVLVHTNFLQCLIPDLLLRRQVDDSEEEVFQIHSARLPWYEHFSLQVNSHSTMPEIVVERRINYMFSPMQFRRRLWNRAHLIAESAEWSDQEKSAVLRELERCYHLENLSTPLTPMRCTGSSWPDVFRIFFVNRPNQLRRYLPRLKVYFAELHILLVISEFTKS